MKNGTQPINRLVVKVGSSVLTDSQGRLMHKRLEALVSQFAWCAQKPSQLLVVSSGAIACGMSILGLSSRPKALAQLQACAAVGQSELMHQYTVALRGYGLVTAQVLLTQEDLSSRRRFANARQTLQTLLERKIVPIINENDTVSVEEITFGDNDRLAALVAAAVDAKLLVILSDVDGLLEDGKVIERVESLSRLPAGLFRGVKRSTTKGGMGSKVEAARIVGHSGIPMVIANGTREEVLPDLLSGKPVGTLFVPSRSRLAQRKWWIAFSLRNPHGVVVIDEGAVDALVARRKSLLASGIVEVRGQFPQGSCVAIINRQGNEVGRGLSNYASSELLRVRGMSSHQLAETLGRSQAEEVIHRDHLVLSEELHA